MASAFSTSNMKAEFHNIRTACSQLVEVRMCQLKRKPAAQCALPIRALYIQHSSMSRQPAAHGKLPVGCSDCKKSQPVWAGGRRS